MQYLILPDVRSQVTFVTPFTWCILIYHPYLSHEDNRIHSFCVPTPQAPRSPKEFQGRRWDDTCSPRWSTTTLHHRQDTRPEPLTTKRSLLYFQAQPPCRIILADDYDPTKDRVIRYQNMKKVCRTILNLYLYVYVHKQNQFKFLLLVVPITTFAKYCLHLHRLACLSL